MAKIQFGETNEEVVTREEFPLEQAKSVLSNDTIAILGYGVQGPAQALNLRDNGFNVIVGQRKGTPSWEKAKADGWVEGSTLFSVEEAAQRGTFVAYLLSDAGQMMSWEKVAEQLKPGTTLCFSHGFAVTFSDQTGVSPSKDLDVVLVAPKGSGRSVRMLFQEGKGINASFAINQDAT
ncbi:MAG: ketol-acid reductoisomerase, partial [Bdellovibrionales bacterium]|nr:ketol-acid reductoisomerase [Bdellovibrionales bacterium]